MIAPLLFQASPNTLSKGTCWADCWAPGHTNRPFPVQIRLVPNWFAKETNFWYKKPFCWEGGGHFWGGKCYLTVAEVISFCASLDVNDSPKRFWWGFSHVEIQTKRCICIPLYITTWHVMYVYICGYMKCIICIYIYIYLPKSSDFVLIHHRNSPKKHFIKRHEGSGNVGPTPSQSTGRASTPLVGLPLAIVTESIVTLVTFFRTNICFF